MVKYLYRLLHPKFQKLFLEYPVDMKPRYGHGLPPHPELYRIVDAQRESYLKLLASVLEQRDRLWEIPRKGRTTNSAQAVWNNGFLPGLDMAVLYTMLKAYKPGRYIEIGSGNSTKLAHKAIEDHQLKTEIISIDPQPRAEIDRLAHRVIREPFESCSIDLTTELNENDILFVDNSHRILPNSDATTFFLEVLPRLRHGVIVHIHDVYLPYDYPPFMCDRFYSEQYGLAMYLLANERRYQPLMPNFFISEDPDLRERLLPLWEHPEMQGVERHGGSFWLKIV